MNTLWLSFSAVEKIYFVIALVSSIVLGVQLIIACVSGMEFHLGSDLGADHHGDFGTPHFQLLTIRNCVAFFVVFGWSGLAFSQAHVPLLGTMFLSFVCGFIMMCVTAAVFLFLTKLQSSGTLDCSQAKGLLATVYLTVPPVNRGKGIIKVTLQGRIVEMEAFSTSDFEIPTGSSVVIKDVTNSKAIVERVGA